MSEPTAVKRPPASRFLTYPGDVRHMAGETRGEVVGPNTLGEHLIAVSAEYDEETNKTRVGFGYLPRR